MPSTWDETGAGVMPLPSGRLIRGRGVANGLPDGLHPEFGVYLFGRRPEAVPWESRWVVWPDFRLPRHIDDARAAFSMALQRSRDERVEVACRGGHGRTGTALACIAILDGISAGDAVEYVRANYRAGAVETRAQQRFVESFR